MDRRGFIKQSSLVSAGMLVPSFVKATSFDRIERSQSGKTLVVIQFSGGNDGLNTLVPFENDLYYQHRPSIAVPKQQVIKIDDTLGFNPALESLRPLYDNGLMAIINSVGYPNPNRSHFRSMDIWHTASDSSSYLKTGWIGRYLDSECDRCQIPYHAIELDDSLSLVMQGMQQDGFAMRNPERLVRITSNPFLKQLGRSFKEHKHDTSVSYLYKTMIEVQQSAEYLSNQAKKHKSNIRYPMNAFAGGLKQIAELMTAGTDTKIYYISLPGFDTHVNQKNRQERLLKIYGESVSAFIKDLQSNNLFNDTLIMTFSEFGRRVSENGSRGTDHGTANNVMIMSGKLKNAGMINQAPDLSNLDNGDLIYQVDFRQIYATVLEKWLDTNPQIILNGGYSTLDFV
jgi:uncharacterized protein (DUF1501 family)